MRIAALVAASFLLLAPAGAIAADASTGPKVLLSTTMGDITLQLDTVNAPLTVANFLHYASEGHFDGTVVYRVVPGFVIQAGSWDADVKYRAVHDPIPLEAGISNLRGTVAMARGDDPASATAEFFINLADNTALDRHADDTANSTGYAVFGHVIGGMDVIDKIAAVPLGDHGPMKGAAPVDPITILKVAVVPDAAP